MSSRGGLPTRDLGVETRLYSEIPRVATAPLGMTVRCSRMPPHHFAHRGSLRAQARRRTFLVGRIFLMLVRRTALGFAPRHPDGAGLGNAPGNIRKGAKMARNDSPNATKQSDPNANLKPGSNPEDARKVGGEGDFGARAGGERTADRDYVSRNTKMSDPGAAQPWDFEQDGVRDHGAGGRASGPGSASGGDIDPHGVGRGPRARGLATSGNIGRPPGPDDSDGSSDEFASGGRAEGRNQAGPGRIGGAKRVQGTTHSGDLDAHTGGDGQGASAVTNPIHELGGDIKHAPHDSPGDAFAGEVSMGEAMGEDNPLSPSSDSQGDQSDD